MHEEHKLERHVEHDIHRIANYLERLVNHFVPRPQEPTALGPLVQIGGNMALKATNNSIAPGGTGVFQSGQPFPVGSALAPGDLPTFLPSDPSIILTPAPDGSTVSAAVPAGTALTAFTLQESYTRASDGVVIQGPPLTVTISAPSNEPTSLGPLTQLS
jgi:hypothetical protein